jgi:hypothetical protein
VWSQPYCAFQFVRLELNHRRSSHDREGGMNVNTAFSRELLKRVLEGVRAYRKSTRDRFAFKLPNAWICKVGTDRWEFYFGKFYWHGSADDAFVAAQDRK